MTEQEQVADMANEPTYAEADKASERDTTEAEADKAGEDGTPKDWQAEAVKWRALAQKHETRAKALHKYEVAELERVEADKTDLDRARDELTSEREQRLELTRRVVAAEHGLPPELAARLQGNTEQELNDDAAGLAELIPKTQTNTPAKLAGIGTAPGVAELDPLAMHRKLTGR
jgi:hypothetical protein